MGETVEPLVAESKPACSCGNCRECYMRAYGAEYYEKNKEEILARQRKHYKTSREKKLARQHRYRTENPKARQVQLEWQRNNPEKLRDHRLKYVYALPSGEYDRMFAAQGGVCARCGKPETTIVKKTGKVRILSVDHCHVTGEIRKLLCHACNPRLGAFEKDLERLIGDIEYLIEHDSPAIEVLREALARPRFHIGLFF